MPNCLPASFAGVLFEAGKRCKQCKEVKPENAFHVYGPGKRMGICGECRAQRRRARGERRRPVPETPKQRLVRKLWDEYKITLSQYQALAEAQGGTCAICRKAPRAGTRLFVDHCHTSGVVRALLCNPCNLMIGVYENHHRAASEYLAAFGDGNPLLKQGAPDGDVLADHT